MAANHGDCKLQRLASEMIQSDVLLFAPPASSSSPPPPPALYFASQPGLLDPAAVCLRNLCHRLSASFFFYFHPTGAAPPPTMTVFSPGRHRRHVCVNDFSTFTTTLCCFFCFFFSNGKHCSLRKKKPNLESCIAINLMKYK